MTFIGSEIGSGFEGLGGTFPPKQKIGTHSPSSLRSILLQLLPPLAKNRLESRPIDTTAILHSSG